MPDQMRASSGMSTNIRTIDSNPKKAAVVCCCSRDLMAHEVRFELLTGIAHGPLPYFSNRSSAAIPGDQATAPLPCHRDLCFKLVGG